MGGGSSEATNNVDTGVGIEEITPEQEARLRAQLGEDYDKLYG